MKGCGGSGCKLDRKTVEKNRRMHMKSLCFKLASLLPGNNTELPKDALPTLQDHFNQAAAHIKELQKRVEDLKCKKEMVVRSLGGSSMGDLKLPLVEIRDMDSTLEVLLICWSGSNNRVLFYDAITVLEEEGAEVVNASFSTVDDKIFYTIHSQVTFARIGLEASRVSERLRQLIH